MIEPRDTVRRTASPFTVVAMFVITVLFAPQFTGPDIGLREFLSLALSSASSAWLFSSVTWWVGAATAVPAALLSFYLSGGSLLVPLCSLLYLPFGIGFALVQKGKLTRGTAVGIGTGVAVSLVTASLLLQVYLGQGTLSLTAVQAQFPETFDLLRTLLESTFTITIAGNEVSYITDANIHEYINLIIGITPGLVGAVMALAGYVGGWIFKLSLRLNQAEPPDSKFWRLKPSPVTGTVFFLAVIALFLTSGVYIVWIAAICIVLVMAPTMGLAGLASVFEIRMVDGRPRPRILRGVILFVGLLSGLYGLILVSLFYGLYDSLIPPLLSTLKRLPKRPKE